MGSPIPWVLRRLRCAWPLVCAASLSTASFAQGVLQQLRTDVRDSSQSSEEKDDDDGPRWDDDEDWDCHRRHRHHDDDDGFFAHVFGDIAGRAIFYTVTSPWWGPHEALQDDIQAYDELCFPRFPYDDGQGYMRRDLCLTHDEDPMCAANPVGVSPSVARLRNWGARLRVEYADEFNDLSRIGGHLLVTTRSRFGLDTETSYLEERLAGGAHDALWIGDCNVVFRFAQSERAQFRTGIGFNWLDDPIDTNFGFNFTYGADLFLKRPWILSATLDWGTLGEAELFRFRTTGGLVVHGVEVYTGYEYLDIDAMQTNMIIGGVRVWF